MTAQNSIPVPTAPLSRPPTTLADKPENTPDFTLNSKGRSYQHQYASIYFVRLQRLRRFVQARAKQRWKDVAGDPPFVRRMLEIVKGELCYIIGTVYIDMLLKPNVLEDIARDRSIPAPPPHPKICSPDDIITLEDESGRVTLVGERLKSAQLVTGVVIAALGMETSGGEFEVIDVCFAGMAPQPGMDRSWGDVRNMKKPEDDSMDVDTVPEATQEEWIALVSGLDVGAPSSGDAQIQMLVEYLTGEAGDASDQAGAARISRIVIAGNSLSASAMSNGNDEDDDNKDKKSTWRYGHDPSTFSPHPALTLSAHLHDLARSMPIHILPGASDPSGTLLPQQPFPRAMFRGAASFATFSCETNPTYIRVQPSPSVPLPSPPANSEGKQKAKATPSTSSSGTRAPTCTLLVSSGQALDDMYKYLPTPPSSRLSIAESSLRWRHIAPTAPDTLWCHPYFDSDPFIIAETPDVYVVGNQPAFATRVVEERGWGRRRGKDVNVEGNDGVSDEVSDEDIDEVEVEKGMEGEGGLKRCRVVLVPRFRETGVLVLLNLRTLAVRTVQFEVEGMSLPDGDVDMES